MVAYKFDAVGDFYICKRRAVIKCLSHNTFYAVTECDFRQIFTTVESTIIDRYNAVGNDKFFKRRTTVEYF